MAEIKSLLQRLGALAAERSKILAEESRLWAEASRAFADAVAVPTVVARRAEHQSPPANSSRDLLTVSQAAEFLRMAKSTLAKWRVSGGGPEFVRMGRKILYRKTTLIEFIATREYPHTSAYGSERK